jgi:hypothetical protein
VPQGGLPGGQDFFLFPLSKEAWHKVENGEDCEKRELKGDIEEGRRREEEDEKGSQGEGIEEISFPVEQDGKKESDHHDRRTNDRDSSPCNEGVKEDERKGQARCPFFDRDGEEKKFRTFEDPEEQGERKKGNDSEMITGDGQKMGNSCDNKVFVDFLWDIISLTQDKSLKNSGRRWMGFPLKKVADMTSHFLNRVEKRILRIFPDGDPIACPC